MKCECEHVDHFDDNVSRLFVHKYGAEFSTVVEVETAYGKLNMCETCFDCYKYSRIYRVEEKKNETLP